MKSKPQFDVICPDQLLQNALSSYKVRGDKATIVIKQSLQEIPVDMFNPFSMYTTSSVATFPEAPASRVTKNRTCWWHQPRKGNHPFRRLMSQPRQRPSGTLFLYINSARTLSEVKIFPNAWPYVSWKCTAILSAGCCFNTAFSIVSVDAVNIIRFL